MRPRDEYFNTSSLEGVRLHALHWGEPDHEKVVLLHGGGANAHWWDHVAPAIAEKFHVIALDFRGHGDADHPEQTRVGALSDDLEALIDHLGRPPVRLVGHSMGAAIALDHACRHTDVRGLVAVDVARGASKRSRRTARLALTLKRTYASREEAIARYRFLPAADHASEALRARIATHSVREEPDGRFGFKFDPRWFSLPSRPRPDLGKIRCPVLVFRGSESPMLTAEGARSLAAELRDARLVVVEGAGHHVHLDRPDAFLEAAVPFLGGVG
ncbi:MAG: alpha/beta hydrolase [Myxococcota bacterium]|nr:alpha/beta hydrolase [Myxococcota bacterium]